MGLSCNTVETKRPRPRLLRVYCVPDLLKAVCGVVVVRNGRRPNGGWSFCPVLPFPRTGGGPHLRIGNSTLHT